MKKIITLMVLLSGTLLAQPMRSGDERGGPNRGRSDFVYFEAINLTSQDSSLARIDVHYRINTDFFVPVKNTDPTILWELKRRGDILLELTDSTDVSRARESNRIEIAAQNSEEDQKIQEWYQGMASFNVPPGRYKLTVELDDLESERKFLDRNTTIRARKLGSLPFDTSTPFFVQWNDSTLASRTLLLENFGGNILFGRRSAFYVEIVSDQPPGTPVHVGYTLATPPGSDETPREFLRDSVSNVQIIQGETLIENKQENAVAYSFKSGTGNKVSGLLIPIHSEQLPLRKFEINLAITQGTEHANVKKLFHMVWPDMPFSLRDVEFALDALKYITTEDQLDSLRRGSFSVKRDHLENFWKAKDPTPETAYNELMVQYYQRVDEAVKQFGTLREPNGLKSDRGRIYILYGAPTRVDRNLSVTKGFQEVWVYENLKKEFVFLDESKNGNYVLVSTQNL